MTLESFIKKFIMPPFLVALVLASFGAFGTICWRAIKKHGAELRYCAYHYPDVDPEDCVTMNLIERIRGKRNEEKARMKK
jgi:hypothetical protein